MPGIKEGNFSEAGCQKCYFIVFYEFFTFFENSFRPFFLKPAIFLRKNSKARWKNRFLE